MAADKRIAQFLPYVLRQWRWLLAISAFTILTSATTAFQPWPVKVLVDYGLGNASIPEPLSAILQWLGLSRTPVAMILLAAGASVCLFALNSALTVALSVSWSMAGQRMVYDVAGDVFARLQRLSLLFHSRRTVGDSLSRLM